MIAPHYYNEFDPYCAQWLRNLIAAKLIPAGEVDERSIVDVQPDDLTGFRQCHFFAGIGGWALAARLAGFPEDRELWTGSAPCQPFSVAGQGKAQADDRHLWPHLFRLVRACRPAALMGEQVAAAVGKDWLDGVFADLEGIDYACGAVVVPACAVDAPHRRDRLWFVAHASGARLAQRTGDAGILCQALGAPAREDAADDRAAGLVAYAQQRRLEAGAQPDALAAAALGESGAGDQSAYALACSGGASVPADADQLGAREGREQRGREFGGPGGDSLACVGAMANANGISGQVDQDAGGCAGGSGSREVAGLVCAGNGSAWGEHAWIIGHDGKARRVEPSICLLAHGVPARVGKLRALGNAIVPQVAAEVIGAYLDCHP